MEQPLIPPKYKHLIRSPAAAVGARCARPSSRGGGTGGGSKEEIAEATMVARQARASTIFATAVEGFEDLMK